MIVSIIVAFDQNKLIGNKNQLPWHLSADLKHFKAVTMGHPIIMGRKTFESIGRPLPGRENIVITRNKEYQKSGITIVNGLEEALEGLRSEEEVFIIGGAEIFKYADTIATKLYTTIIHEEFEGDTWFPEINEAEWTLISKVDFEVDEKNKWPYSFIDYERKK